MRIEAQVGYRREFLVVTKLWSVELELKLCGWRQHNCCCCRGAVESFTANKAFSNSACEALVGKERSCAAAGEEGCLDKVMPNVWFHSWPDCDKDI